MGVDTVLFFPDNQVTGQAIQDVDWSAHPLGDPSSWPISLKITLNTLFNTRHAVGLFWGEKKFYFYNDACIPILGPLKHPRAMARPGGEVWPEIWDLISPQIDFVMTRGEASSFVDQHLPVKRAGKSTDAYFTYNYSPVIDEDGLIRGALVIFVETTEKRLLEKKLLEKNLIESRDDFYRVLMQAPSAVAFLKGPKLIFNLANSRYQEIFGEEIIGKPMKVALPNISEESYRIFENVYLTGKPFVAKEYKSTAIGHGAGNEVYFNFAVQRINDIKGEAEGIIIIGDDITDQVKDRIAREELTKHLQAIVQNMGEGLVLADQSGKMLIWNPAAWKLHGFKSENEVYEHLSEFREAFQLYTIEGDVLDFSEWPMTRVIKGESFSSYEVIVERLDNNERWIGSFNGSPIFNEFENLIFAVLTIRDVTSRIDSERELRNAINSRDEFLSIVSHELKTPLTSLKLQNQSAMRKILKGNIDDLSPEKLTQLFIKNESQINRVIRLVDDMLDLTRVQSGRMSYNFIKCDLCEIVADVYERFKEQFENTETNLINFCKGEVIGFFDRDRIEQVIVNLLTNALKYGQSKEVTINMEVSNNVARLEIEDHGMGIKQENFELIFKKYERVVSADEVSGLGIGLFISKEIVEAHGGQIWVESKIGEGARFIAELPLDANNLKKI